VSVSWEPRREDIAGALGDEFALYADESKEWAQVTFAAHCEAIRQLEGWPRLVESHELAKRINRGDFDE
jgi:hypothetical protein